MRVATVLCDAGLEPGDRVAAQVPKCVGALELYVGTVLAGGVFLPLNTAYTESELGFILEDATPRVFVCDPCILDSAKELAHTCGVQKLLTLSNGGRGTLTNERDRVFGDHKTVARSASDPAAILYTSGTTGRPKGAVLSHGALASNAQTLVDVWRFTPDDILIHALPIFHTHGLFVAINVTMCAGSACKYFPKFNAVEVVQAMADSTVLMGVPTFYTRLLEQSGLAEAAKGMRLFISGSAPLTPETHDKWQRATGHAILERYGMTETNMITSNPYDGERRAGSVGLPLPGINVAITHPTNGVPKQRSDVGMIEVRGPNLFSEYWKSPERTTDEMRDNGFFITGDLGQFDEDGYLYIVGRKKDLIITGGYNVYPKEIEQVLDEHPGVSESAVFGVPHPDFGEGVVAAVVPEAHGNLVISDLSNEIAASVARYKQPKRIVLLDELPRNLMGKVQKNVLREKYQDSFAP